MSGISSSAVPAGVPSMPETTRRVERSVPPSLVPMATREPSRDGANQSTALAASAASAPGSASVTGATPGSAAERRASRNCSAPAGRSTVNRWSPRRVASSTTGSCISATRRSCQRARPGKAVDDGAGEGVLGSRPGDHLGVVTVLQPAVGIGDGGAVVVVDDVLTPGRRDGTGHRHSGSVSRGPCSGACRGSPWSGACGPWPSWSLFDIRSARLSVERVVRTGENGRLVVECAGSTSR